MQKDKNLNVREKSVKDFEVLSPEQIFKIIDDLCTKLSVTKNKDQIQIIAERIRCAARALSNIGGQTLAWVKCYKLILLLLLLLRQEILCIIKLF